MESGAGGLAWLGPAGRVGMRLAPEAVGPGSSPDTDILSPDTTSRKSVPNDAQQRVVTPADAATPVMTVIDRGGEKNGGRKKAGWY